MFIAISEFIFISRKKKKFKKRKTISNLINILIKFTKTKKKNNRGNFNINKFNFKPKNIIFMPYKGLSLKDVFLCLFIIIKFNNKVTIYEIYIKDIINNYNQIF